jgi:hypothetical protein
MFISLCTSHEILLCEISIFENFVRDLIFHYAFRLISTWTSKTYALKYKINVRPFPSSSNV